MDYEYYPPKMTVTRDEYSRKRYYDTYRDFCKHYGYKARVEGGWIFFENLDDFLTWKNQK